MTGKEYLTIEKETAGIYWFRNIDTNQYYVGQSLDLRKRFNKHLSRVRRKKNYPLYNALNKYGFDKFEYHIEVIVSKEGKSVKEITDELNKLEIEYIKKFDAFNNGYNLTIGGDSISGYVQSNKTREHLSKVLKEIYNDGRNKIYTYNIITKEYSEWNTLRSFLDKYKIKSNGFVNKEKLVNNQWIAAKTKNELEEKIKNILNRDSIRNNGKWIIKNDLNDLSLIEDIQNLTIKDFLIKYNITKGTYYNYLKRLNISRKKHV